MVAVRFRGFFIGASSAALLLLVVSPGTNAAFLFASKNNGITPLLAATREPAGVESLFSIVRSSKTTTKKEKLLSTKTTSVKKRARIKTSWLRRTNQGAASNNDNMIVSDELLKQTKKQLTLPSWVYDNAEEEERLAAMKYLLRRDLESLKDVTVKNNVGVDVPVMQAFPDVYGDLRLLRCLRKDKKQNAKSACVRYQKFLQWRQKHNVDLVRMAVEEAPFKPSEPECVVSKYIPSDFDVNDENTEDTVPVLLHVGTWDTFGITNLIQQEHLSMGDFLKYWMYMYESIHWKLYRETMKRKQMVYIDEVCDLTEVSMRQFTPGFVSRVIKPWVTMTQANYPETAKHIVLLNPPRIMSLAWSFVSPFLNAGTVEKIRLRPGFDGDCHEFIKNQDIDRGDGDSI